MKKSRVLRGCALATTLIFTSGCAMVSNVDSSISENMDIGAKTQFWQRDLCGIETKGDLTTEDLTAKDITLTDLYPQQGCVAFASALISWKRYRDAADDITTGENLLNIGILSLAAGTIWAAVSEGPDDLVAGLGLGTAVLYGGSSILAPEQKREIYRAGARATACVMRRANSMLTDPIITGNYQHKLNKHLETYKSLRQTATPFLTSTPVLNNKLKSLLDKIIQDQQAIDTHNLNGARASAEVSQLLIEIDNKLRELLDQTLPNPATIFETVRSSTTGYLTQTGSFPTLPISQSDNSFLPIPQEATSGTLLVDASDRKIFEKDQDENNEEQRLKEQRLKEQRLKEQRLNEIKENVNKLAADLEIFHLSLQAALKEANEFDFEGCNDLGIETKLVLTESEISLQAGQSATVSIISGKRPIRATMTRKPAGLTLDRDFNQDGDTEYAIHWNGTGNQYGSYPVRFIDDNGASNVMTLNLSPGVILAKTELVANTDGTATLTIENGSAPFRIFYQGTEPAPVIQIETSNEFSDYAYGAEVKTEDQNIILKIANNSLAAGTTKTFMIIDKTGKSAGFTITMPQEGGT